MHVYRLHQVNTLMGMDSQDIMTTFSEILKAETKPNLSSLLVK